MGLFVADPMIQLMLLDSQVILPTSDCYNPLLPNQTCSTDVNVAYYFWNLTNEDEVRVYREEELIVFEFVNCIVIVIENQMSRKNDDSSNVYTHIMQWLQGLSPPQYKEVGPFSFRAKEVRYNVNFDANWNEVEYTFHQWADFMPASSCAECTMDANLTSINRGYLQFLSSSTSPVDPETAVIYATMPMTLSIITGITTNMIAQFEPNASTIAYDSIRQWTDCSFLLVSLFYFIYCFFIYYYQS